MNFLYSGEWAFLNKDIYARFGGAMVPDPEQMQESYEACGRGELPAHVPIAFQIPTIVDPTLDEPIGFFRAHDRNPMAGQGHVS